MATKILRQHFSSINEFYKFITTESVNEVFKQRKEILASQRFGTSWEGTETFEEAADLMLNGWSEMAKKLEGKLQAKIKNVSTTKTRKTVYDVVGGNCSVPRYLQGIPTNMINQKTAIKRQPVVTINKNISYAAVVSSEKIIQESIKAFEIVRRIEAGGTRVNLNIAWSSQDSHNNSFSKERFIVTIRIKNAGERLNISKMAFPLVHPSMLRRLSFRWLEVNKLITCMSFNGGYGYAKEDIDCERCLPKNEIFLPKIVNDVDEIVNSFK